MDKFKVMAVFGTRPEAIKMAPLVLELKKCEKIETIVAVTAQHREMLDQVLECFNIVPDYDLNVMKPGQTLAHVTSAVLTGMLEVIEKEKPNLVLVHGDTTTTFAGALAAFYGKTGVGHVEAGLRTFDKYAPYPEEMNRCLTGVLSDLHFAPTIKNKENLLACGVPEEKIYITGNTVIDALLNVTQNDYDLSEVGLGDVDWNRKVVLLTCHRRENWGKPMEEIFKAVKQIKAENPDVDFVFPVHKNPLVRDLANEILGNTEGIYLTEPLEYVPFSQVMKRAYLVMTDSGGLQEEAPALGKPVLVLREVTERPEAVEAGTAKLIGNTFDTVYQETTKLLQNKKLYDEMAHAANPYGTGKASQNIVEAIISHYNL